MRRQLFSGRLEPQGSALGGPERGRHPDAHRSEVLVSPPEESQKQKELTKAEMQKVLKEKAQLTADLHSMEKSFSDLFKRFEKQKEVIEGYRTVGAGPAWGRGRGGALQEEELSTALVRSLARGRGRPAGGASLSPACACTLGSWLVTCNWTRVPARRPCGPAWRLRVCAGRCTVPHRQTAGHPAARARGSGNRTGCSVGLVPDLGSPTVPGQNPRGRALRARGSAGEDQADERARVAWLSWRVSGR